MSDPFDLSDDFVPASADAPSPWLTGLNPEQREAVETTEGPLLVLSGAGTGKTRVLTSRLAHILMNDKARPWQCLAATFTNRASREMKERVARIAGPSAERVWLGTFHSLGARMLRRCAEQVGLRHDFSILDMDDQLRLIKRILEAEGIDAKRNSPKALAAIIQRWKDRGLTPERIDASDIGEFADRRALTLYAAYQEQLGVLNACDFGDLLLHPLTVMQNNPSLLADYQNQFRYILVDEYQDTNIAQYLWLRLLAQKHKNLCCVGDDDQSIYSWRGAEIGNILKFETDFPDAKIIRLEANYRSTPTILEAASGLIAHNRSRLGKTLRAGEKNAELGEKIVVRGLWDGEEEARWVVEEIEALHRKGTPLNQIAILVRAGFQTREFEESLIRAGVPYRVVGGMRFYERQEIRDALAYLRVVAQPADDLAFERIINLPKRGLGETTLQAMRLHARSLGLCLTDAAARLTSELRPKAHQSLSAFLADLSRWSSLIDGLSQTDLAQTILDESGYLDMWRKEKTLDAEGRLDNLRELIAAMSAFDSLQSFLEHVSLVMENDEKDEQSLATIMTLHAAKGLEFDAVFLPGWEEGLFPHQRALEEGGGLEEERRLAYVGLTRAKLRVFITHASNRRIYNQWQNALASRFLEELPEDATDRLGDGALFGGSRRDASAWSAAWNAGYVTQRARKSAESGGNFAPAEYRPGEKIFHQKFGPGVVIAVDGSKLDIVFDEAGSKKIIDRFVSRR